MAVVVVDAATERCPFPGLAAHAAVRTRMEPERSLKWPLDRSDFAPGETLVYSCLADRQIPTGQSAALTCRRDGTWDAPVPRCDRLSEVGEWSITFWNGSVYQRLNEDDACHTLSPYFRLQLDADNEDISNVTIHTCASLSEATIEAVTPIGPTCRSTNTVAGSISFSCESVDHRRRYHGIDVRFSSATSLKSVSALIRSGNYCSLPPIPLNSQPKLAAPTIVEYNCKGGLQLVGPTVSLCDPSSGRWSDVPECLCSGQLQPTPSYLMVSQRTNLQVTYQCAAALEMIGDDTIRCDVATGRWGPAPTCRCREPDAGIYGINLIRINDTAVRYECDDDHQAIAVCHLDSGEWSAPPACPAMTSTESSIGMEATQSTKSLPSTDVDEKLVNRCPFPGIPARATARSSKDDAPISWSTKRSFDPDERLIYTCDVKSKMASDQNDTITCGADGAWIGSLPRCDRLMELSDWRIRYTKSGFIWIAIKRKERPCSKLYRARKFHLSSSADEGQGVTEVTVQACYKSATFEALAPIREDRPGQQCLMKTSGPGVATFDCQHIDGRQATRGLFINLSNRGDLKSVVALIKETDNCGYPPVPLDAEAWLDDSVTVSYQCPHPLQLVGSSKSTCHQPTGEWTPMPMCVPIETWAFQSADYLDSGDTHMTYESGSGADAAPIEFLRS